MEAQDIKDVLQVRDIIANADGTADLIANLITWRDQTVCAETLVPQQDHSVAENAAAKVEAKAAPVKAAAKAAPAKAAPKGRAKPPPPPADDDNEPSPDPSDDADF